MSNLLQVLGTLRSNDYANFVDHFVVDRLLVHESDNVPMLYSLQRLLTFDLFQVCVQGCLVSLLGGSKLVHVAFVRFGVLHLEQLIKGLRSVGEHAYVRTAVEVELEFFGNALYDL